MVLGGRAEAGPVSPVVSTAARRANPSGEPPPAGGSYLPSSGLSCRCTAPRGAVPRPGRSTGAWTPPSPSSTCTSCPAGRRTARPGRGSAASGCSRRPEPRRLRRRRGAAGGPAAADEQAGRRRALRRAPGDRAALVRRGRAQAVEPRDGAGRHRSTSAWSRVRRGAPCTRRAGPALLRPPGGLPRRPRPAATTRSLAWPTCTTRPISRRGPVDAAGGRARSAVHRATARGVPAPTCGRGSPRSSARTRRTCCWAAPYVPAGSCSRWPPRRCSTASSSAAGRAAGGVQPGPARPRASRAG